MRLPPALMSMPAPAFACPGLNNNLGPMPEFGVNLNVWYQPGSVLGNHGGGLVIVNPNCSNP